MTETSYRARGDETSSGVERACDWYPAALLMNTERNGVAGSPDDTSTVHPRGPHGSQRRRAAELIASVDTWYHQIEIAPGLTTPGINDSQTTLAHLGIPERLDGKRVLDIGARDGFFSFECERRGAEVLAIDYFPAERTGFPIAKRLLESEVEYCQDNVYDLSTERYGEFDLVLFLGVLYHLRDPMLALDRIHDLCRDQVIVETHLIDEAFLRSQGDFRSLASIHPELESTCIMQFYPGDSLNNDSTNVWAPNSACLRAMLEESGFDIEHQTRVGNRGIVRGRRVDDERRLYFRRLDRSA